ncbi:hypothetical protein [Mycobacterium paraseoulense]|nr:hypothetical protein [Mycobacterium paraseoulense]BBZ72043.1 hypothetical protein MPRS_31360 [Mycobacterium paraseoulense]
MPVKLIKAAITVNEMPVVRPTPADRNAITKKARIANVTNSVGPDPG